jgi:Lrp/AsnC family transcriptional regulator, regulator for asnA, asnC and gidA
MMVDVSNDHGDETALPGPVPPEAHGFAPVGSRVRRRPGVTLDPLSRAIIEQLQQDGRRPYATIGKAVGLSEAAVRQRVQKLLDGGVMQIVAVTDPLTVGFHREAMIGIRCEGDIEPVAEALSAMPEVSYVVATAGAFDLMVEVVAEDDDQLLEIINKRIRVIAQVRSTESFVYLKLHKQTYTWGTR